MLANAPLREQPAWARVDIPGATLRVVRPIATTVLLDGSLRCAYDAAMFRVGRTVVGGVVYQMTLSKNSRPAGCCLAIMATIVVSGCRPSEPVPAYYEDLGTEDRPLLPTSAPWKDAAIVRGQADWRPFRKPGAEAKASGGAAGETKSAAGNPGIEAELRGLVNDFNAAVAEGKFDEAADVLIEEQIAPAKQVVELIPVLVGKIKEIAEVLPGDNENLKKAVAGASLSAVLKLDVASLTVSSPTEAVGKPASTPGGAGDVRFVLVKGKDGEYWYIDHPQIRAMVPALPSLQLSLPQLDAFIAGVKSGQIGGEALVQLAAAMNQMLGSMLPAGSPPAAASGEPKPPDGEAGKDAKPEDRNGG